MTNTVFESQGLTTDELWRAQDYLGSTKEGLLAAINGLSEAQSIFQPGPDRWSAAEILEHIAIIEGRVHAIILRMPEADLADATLSDNTVIRTVSNRDNKIQAPPVICPSGKMSLMEAVQRLEDSRVRTLELLREATHLRGRVVPHPILGPLEGYQWILAVGAHCLRHTAQIAEIKASPNFPAS